MEQIPINKYALPSPTTNISLSGWYGGIMEGRLIQGFFAWYLSEIKWQVCNFKKLVKK